MQVLLSRLLIDRWFHALLWPPLVVITALGVYWEQWSLAWVTTMPILALRLLLLQPVVEELAFRGAVQSWLLKRWPTRWGILSLANAITSLLFTGLHFFFHPPWWAAGVLFPSLVFGWMRERFNSVWPCVLLHGLYNLGFFLSFPPIPY